MLGHPQDDAFVTTALPIAASARRLFDDVLYQSLGHQHTNGTCLHASVLCQMLLERFTSADARVCGGDGEGDGGLFLGDAAHGHYWVEAAFNGEAYVVDLTADQFGLPGVIVLRFADTETVLGARYERGCQRTVDEHVQELRVAIGLP